MKKIINVFLISLSFTAIFLTHSIVKAQQQAEMAKEQANKTINYLLPYPGILPDSPLYKIKMFRDQIIAWFISDPLKKAEYYLLMADKRVSAGKMLVDYGKTDLGQETVGKGQAYLSLALELAAKAKSEGKDISSLMDKLDKAASKHLEVLEAVLEKAPDSAKKGLENAIENSQKGHDRVLEIMERKEEKEKKKEEKEEKEKSASKGAEQKESEEKQETKEESQTE